MIKTNFKLVFENKSEIIKKIVIKEKSNGQILIGRDEKCNVILKNPEISKNHAIIHVNNHSLSIEDLASTNGTYVNHEKLIPNQPKKIQIGDKVYFSKKSGALLSVLSYDNAGFYGKENNNDDVIQTDVLSLIDGKKRITIGRSDNCDIRLLHPQISRQHCEIYRNHNGRLIVKDYSKNGTFINGKKINNKYTLESEDKIMIGPFVIPLRGKIQDITKEVAIRAEGVEKTYSGGIRALNNCYLNVPTRTLMAIMGPSGCGKSTLLKTLNGEAPATRGKVYLFNQELVSNYEYLKTQIGYVPQDDIVHRELTVEQSMYFAAKLRLENRSEKEIYNKIDEILNSLNISFIKNQLVGQISGGQRKRVSIAVELLTDPLILFLDEPTSPLDPQTIEEFLKILKNLANSGTTVVMVTHKPEDLEYMDTAMFLAEGGHIVYDGPANTYTNYFQVKSPVEVYASLVGSQAKKWISKFNSEQKIKKKSFTQNQKKENHTSADAWKQFYWLSARYLKIKTNDRINSAILIFQAPIIALLICIIFEHINQAVPFLIAISAIWFGTNNAAREIVGELPIYLRERMFNLKIVPYIFSKMTVLTIFAFIQSFLFICIIYLRYDNPEWNNFLGSILWMVFISIAATLMGLVLSSLANTSEKVMSIVPISLIPQIMLAGVIAKISNPVVEWISYITLSRWGTEGLSIIQKKVYTELPIYGSNITSAIDQLKSNFHKDYNDYFGEWAGTLSLDFLAVLILSGLFFYFTYSSLKKKDAINN